MTTEPEQKKSGKRRTAAEERERARQAAQLKIGGATFEAIARALEYTDAAAAYRAYRNHLRRNTPLPDDVEHYRELEVTRLEDLRQAIYAQAVGDPGGPGRAPTPPDLEAVSRLLAIHDRLVRLLGLHRAPTIDPTEELIRWAEARDLDVDTVLRQADGIIATNGRRWSR